MRTAAVAASCGAARDGCCRGSWSAGGAATRSHGKMARGRVGGQRPADYGYYRCTGTDAHRFAGQAVCDNRSVRSDRLEQAVWDEIRAVLEDPERVAAEHRRRLAEVEDGPNDAKDADLGRRIAALRRGIGRLIDAYAEGLIERGEFEPRVEGMRRRLAHAEKERQTMAANAEAERDLTLLVGCLEEFAEKVHRGLQGLDWEGTREIMRAMVRRVEVDGDRLDIVFRVPPPSRPGGDDHPGSPTPPSGRVRQDCRGRHAVLVGEDADHVCTALHFLVQALDGVRAVELRAVAHREPDIGQHVGLGVVHERGRASATGRGADPRRGARFWSRRRGRAARRPGGSRRPRRWLGSGARARGRSS